HFLVGLDGSVDSRPAPDPRVATISPDHQRGGQNPSIFQAYSCSALTDVERLGNRRAEKGHVVLPLQAFPEFHVHQAGLSDPRQFAYSAFVSGEAQFAPCIPVYLHLGNRRETRMVQVCPHAKVFKKCSAGGAVCIDSLVPAVRPARRPQLDQRDLETTAAKRYRHGSAGKSATNDDEVEFHVMPT